MKLNRAITFFDLESTGVDVSKDRIVEISATRINVDGSQAKVSHIINPGIPIPKESSDIHGITDQMVEGAFSFDAIALQLYHGFFKDCDVSGFNILKFDIVLLMNEFNRCAISWPSHDMKVIDSYFIFSKFHPRTLKAAVKQYLGEDIVGAHTAEGDVDSCIRVAMEQINTHFKSEDEAFEFCNDLSRVDYAGKLYKDKDGVVRYSIGKDKGCSVSEKPDFGFWMMKQTWVSNDTIRHLQMAMGLLRDDKNKVEADEDPF